MTIEEAKRLTYGDVLHVNIGVRCERWRVNGKVRTWKKKPNKVVIPAKGLYAYTHFHECDLNDLHKESECQRGKGGEIR